VLVIVMILLPLLLIAAAAVAAMISIRNSSVRLTAAGVEVANHRQPPRFVPLDQVDHFEPPAPVGWLSSVRPSTGVLVLTDGSRVVVRNITDPEAGRGVDALNARLARLRAGP
jgi:hypothetical protein